MSNRYYADCGYGYANIDLKKEESISFAEIQKLIELLKSKSAREYYSKLSYDDFFSVEELDYDEAQHIWELAATLAYQETGIDFSFTYDEDYNETKRCIMVMNKPIYDNKSVSCDLIALRHIMEKYAAMITKKQFYMDYLTCISYG